MREHRLIVAGPVLKIAPKQLLDRLTVDGNENESSGIKGQFIVRKEKKGTEQ